jgi:hypothetical protein
MAQMVVTAGSLMRSVLLPFILSALLIWNLPTVNHAIGNLLAMTARIQSLEASGVRVAFGDAKKLDLSLAAAKVDPTKIDDRIKVVRKLTGVHVDRLFTLDSQQVHCVFTKPDLRMSLYLTLDYELENWKLVESSFDEAALAKLRDASAGQALNIGEPRSCYRLKLTDVGYDAKTALLGIMRMGLDGGGAPSGV